MDDRRRRVVSTLISRRHLLMAAAAIPAAKALSRRPLSGSERAARAFDPWLEVDSGAIGANAREASRLAGGRPVLAVVKNNGYGLGVTAVAAALEDIDAISGCAVVTGHAATELAEAGFSKPIVLMGRVDEDEAHDLAARGVRLTTIDDHSVDQMERVARQLGRAVPAHLYLDTGMNRVGVSFRRATDVAERLAAARSVALEGTFMGFAEEDEFDEVQLTRFRDVTGRIRDAGLDLGRLHAASSHGLFFRPGAHLEMIRPGLVLYGAYPSGARGLESADFTPAFRLRARVTRVERLEPGDSVSYGRGYVAERPTWVATLPVGHADGYLRTAVDGCEVLIGRSVYRVIGAVSASHTIVEVGAEKRVEVGDDAILVGPDHPAIHPNEVAERAGVSVYDILMHLSARLPRHVA